MKKRVIFFLIVILSFTGYAAASLPNITIEEAKAKLIEGNKRFTSQTLTHPHQDLARLKETTQNGQNPFATVIACSDSRSSAEIIFDQGIGDLFVIRVVGNVVDIDEAASIEYSVEHLSTPLLVIMGHSHCGAVKAVIKKLDLQGNIPDIIDNIIPAVEKVRNLQPDLTGDEFYRACEIENIWQSIEDLFKHSKTTTGLVLKGQLEVVGAYYNIDTGLVEWLGTHPNQAELLGDPTPVNE